MDLSQDPEIVSTALADIHTDRLRLRVPQLEDVDWLAVALSDPRIVTWLTSVPVPFERHHAMAWITRDRQPGSARIIERAGQPVGVVHIGPDLVYWLEPTHWGNGLAREAAAALVDWFFLQGADRLPSGFVLDNTASARILQGLGFVHGTQQPRRCNLRQAGVTVQTVSLTRGVWAARRSLPTLETPRLSLRPMTDADAPVIAQLAGVPEVAPMIFRAKIPWPLDEVRTFIRDWAWKGEAHFRLAVTLKDGTIIGSVGISGEPHVFYFFHKDHWGGGYATEAMRAFLRACYAHFPDLDELGADVFQENLASTGVLTKLGFAQTGTDMGTSAARLEPAPVNVYRLTRATFRDIP